MEYVAYIRWGQGWDTGFQFIFKCSLLVQTLLEKGTLTYREMGRGGGVEGVQAKGNDLKGLSREPTATTKTHLF